MTRLNIKSLFLIGDVIYELLRKKHSATLGKKPLG